jgi:hypothetical protein
VLALRTEDYLEVAHSEALLREVVAGRDRSLGTTNEDTVAAKTKLGSVLLVRPASTPLKG